jgi:hypothetical protein
MSIVAYGYGIDAPVGAGTATVDLGDVEISTAAIVVELEDVNRIIDLPDDLVVSLGSTELVVTIDPDLEVTVDDSDNDVEVC